MFHPHETSPATHFTGFFGRLFDPVMALKVSNPAPPCPQKCGSGLKVPARMLLGEKFEQCHNVHQGYLLVN